MSTMGYVTTLTGAEDSANLNIDFEKQSYKVMEGGKQVSKNFSDIITFTRSTNGGRFNEKGLYETVGANQPRLDYSPITKLLRGLLVEEARTNLRTYSAMSSWGVSNSGTKIQPALSLDGKMTALEVSNTVGASSYMTRAFSAPAGVYTHSVFAKPTGDNFTFVFAEVQGAGNTTFNAITKVFTGGAATTKGFEELGNGWMRVWITTTEQAQTPTTIYIGAYGSTNVQSRGILWGYQIELGAFPTSYVPTVETFNSRASSATYFDKNGVLRSAGVNVPRSSSYVYDQDGVVRPYGLILEETSANLLRRAGEFLGTAPWASVGVTLTRALGLDGGLTATRIVEDAVTSVKEVRQTNTITAVSGNAYTYSIYAKAITGADRQIRVGFGNGGIIAGGAQAVFNLKDHTIASVDGGTYVIQKLGDGWARYSYTVIATNTATITNYLTLLVLGGAGYQGDSVSGCLVYGAQIEVGRLATSYIQPVGTFTSRSTTATYIDSNGLMQTAGINVARDAAYGYEGDSGILRPMNLLLESSSANLLSYSHDYTSGKWDNVGTGTTPLTITPNAANGTRGANTMTLIERKDLGGRYLSKVFTAGVGTILTRTQRIKAVEGSNSSTWFTLRLQATYPNLVDAWFNPLTGEFSGKALGDCTFISASMTKEADGVWLCSLTGKSGADSWKSTGISVLDRVGSTDATPTALSSLYIDCAQVEIGPVATSYIPTTTTSVGRAADISNAVNVTRAADISSSVATTRSFESAYIADLPTWYNFAEGTMDVTFTPGQVGVGGTTVAYYMRTITDAAKNVISCRRNSAGIVTTVITDNTGTNQAILDGLGGTLPNTRLHVSTAIKKDNFAISVGGRAAILDALGNTPTPQSDQRFYLGSAGTGTQNANGYIQKFSYYPLRLTNSQIESLSN